MKKDDKASNSVSKRRSIPVAVLLILVILLSASLGFVGASFFAQQANVTVTTTIYTTTTSWTTSTIWSTLTQVVQGVLTTVEYTTSTNTITVTGSTTPRIAKIVTAKGNARITTGQSEFGGASGLFSGSGAYLSTPDSADWYFGTGDFTIDFWVRWNALPTAGKYQFFFGQNNPGTGDFQNFGIWNNGGTYQYYVEFIKAGVAKCSDTVHSTTFSVNTWYHIALVRSGSSVYIFQNGAQVGSTITISANDLPDSAGSWIVGAYSANQYYLNGWLDEFRVSTGVARWTSNFTPPTSEYGSDSSTVLLLHMNGADGSTTFTDSVT